MILRWRSHLAVLAICALCVGFAPARADQQYRDAKDGSSIGTVVIEGLNGSHAAVPSGSLQTATATIANGQSLSGAVDLGDGGMRAFGIIIPSVWTGTTTSITYQAGVPGSDGTCATATWNELYSDGGTEVTTTVTGVSTYIVFSQPVTWLGVRCMKVRSGTAGSPVTQGQSTVLTIVAVP